MNTKLQHYVGKIVRLNQQAFQQIRDRARRQGVSLENSFLVTEVRLGMKKLICYGAVSGSKSTLPMSCSFKRVIDRSRPDHTTPRQRPA